MYINNKITKLPKEIEKGNTEYKRKIHNINEHRFFQLTTQLKWRLNEGFDINNYYSAIYIIGIEDNGNISGMTKEDNEKTIINIKRMVKSLDLYIKNIYNINHKKGYITEIHIEKKNNINIILNDYQLCLFGDTLSGKTTLLSILLNNVNDDGNGFARNKILKHIHEFENGKTSSISEHLLYIKNNDIINDFEFSKSKNEMINSSNKIISIIDLPGDKKFIKTILFGLLAYIPSLILYLISIDDIFNNKNINKIISNIKIFLKLKVTFFIVINKIDLNKNYISTLKKFQNILFKKINIKSNLITKNIDYDYNLLNIIPVSCVTKNKISFLKNYLINFEKKKKKINNDNTEFLINNVSYLPDLGIIISGILLKGNILINDILKLGPVNNKFVEIKIISIHRKQVPFNKLNCNDSGSMFIKIINNKNKINITKRMMIISNELINNVLNSFFFITDNKKIKNLENKNSLVIYFNNFKDNIIIKSITKKNDNYILEIKLINKLFYIIDNNNAIIKKKNKIIIGKIFKNI
jgi:GTPase